MSQSSSPKCVTSLTHKRLLVGNVIPQFATDQHASCLTKNYKGRFSYPWKKWGQQTRTAATVDLAILLHNLIHPRIQSGGLRSHPLLTVLLGLERLTMERTTRISMLQLRHLFAKPMHRKPASVESPVVETSGQSYTSSSYTAPARPCYQCSSKL